jgi:uncharacterized membrane protein YfcA
VLTDTFLYEVVLYLLTGVFAGLASGLLGVGGGIIIVPVLYFIFVGQADEHNRFSEYVMHMALATSLATIIITSISSAYAHHKKDAVLWFIAFRLTPGILIGAWAGGIVASHLDTEPLKYAFGFFELFVAFHLFLNYQPQQHSISISPVKSFFGGSIIGTVSSIVGIGGGTLTVPFLHWHKINIKNAVATSAACGFPIAVAGTASYIYHGWQIPGLPPLSLGFVNLTAFIFIILTSFLMAPVGAKLAHRIHEDALRKVFAVFLLLISLKMILH